METSDNSIKKTVLITGASSGIGYEFAKIFAKKDYNLVLVARTQSKLINLVEELKKNYKISVHIMAIDLLNKDAVYKLIERIKEKQIDIDILVNNAGIGHCGLFHQEDLTKYLDIINLNIKVLTTLTHLITQDMIKKKSGKILNVASTGSYQPGPLTAVYYASKAYVLSFSAALANELKPYGITVTTLCPGATKTEFAKNAGKVDLANAMSAEKVAKIAYKSLMKKKGVVIPGILNKISVYITRLIPASISAKIVRKIQEKVIY